MKENTKRTARTKTSRSFQLTSEEKKNSVFAGENPSRPLYGRAPKYVTNLSA